MPTKPTKTFAYENLYFCEAYILVEGDSKQQGNQ